MVAVSSSSGVVVAIGVSANITLWWVLLVRRFLAAAFALLLVPLPDPAPLPEVEPVALVKK